MSQKVANAITRDAIKVEEDQTAYRTFFSSKFDRGVIIDTALELVDWNAVVNSYPDKLLNEIVRRGPNFAPHKHVGQVVLGAVKRERRRRRAGVAAPKGHGMTEAGTQG